ncbi:MAG: MFS transporter [Acidimicrobiales bacterium]
MTDTVTISPAFRPTDAAGPSERTHRPGLALVVIATAQLMVMLDLTIVNIALPSMQRELGFSATGLSWVVDAYVLAFGGLLLFGGRTGDLFGRRRMLVIGIGLFTAASLAGGLATSQSWLITARVIQGLGAAIASPTALSLIGTTFPEGHRRHKAMAVYAGMSGAGGALGLLLGGLLVDAGSWRWVMFVNVPIGLALIVAAPLVLPDISGRRGRLDLPGALTVTAGMALLVFGLEHAPTSGWSDPFTVAAFGAAAILLAVFVLIEARSADALLPMRFLRNRRRVGGYAIMLLLGAAMLSLLYFLTQFLQDVLHYSPIVAGAAYLPLPIVVGSAGLVVSRLVGRIGIRVFLTTGPLLVAGGLWWLSFLTGHSGYPAIFGPLVVVGAGMGFSFVPLTLNAVSAVGNNQMGLASGLLNTSQQVGGSLGLAALVTVASTVTRDSLARHAAALHSAGGAAALSAGVHGYQAAFRSGAIAAGLAVLFALVLLRPAESP